MGGLRLGMQARRWYSLIMETVIRQVRDLRDAERSAIEQLVGHALRADQQLVIQVKSLDVPTLPVPTQSAGKLPAWTHVYDGLSDDQVADLERVVLERADLSRSAHG
jgi:hypothetical protein